MPVYVRRRQAETPETLGEFSTDDEDFIVDPDQCRDLLPQPFRLVAKLLDAAVDDIWQYIAHRKGEREAERQRVLPPQYGAGGSLESIQRVNCICASPDNEIVFVGQSDGISAVRVGQHSEGPVDNWQNSEFDITSLSCSVIAENTYLLAANDDMGVARLFAFAGDRFLLLKIMNDTEGDKKVLATKIDLSSTSEFCALSLDNPGTGEVWLEVHKIPREAWTKELEGVVNARRQAAAKKAAAQSRKNPRKRWNKAARMVASQPASLLGAAHAPRAATRSGRNSARRHASMPIRRAEETSTEDGQHTHRSSTAPGKGPSSHKPRATVSGRSRARAATSRSLPPPGASAGPSSSASSLTASNISAGPSPVEEDRTVHKFSSPTLILRCRPTPKVTGNAASTLAAALKGVDATGEVLGTGAGHPLSSGHLEQRQTVFESLHEHQLCHLPPASEEVEREFQSATWHFLKNGRSLPYGLEMAQNENGVHHTAGIALWWRGARQLFVFSLVRPAKEVEHRPEQLLPFSSPISASCLSTCSSQMAVGLTSGHVLLHDWHKGLARRLLHVSDVPVWRLRFLGPLEPPQMAATEYPPYKDQVELKLLVVTEEKTIHTVEAGPWIYHASPHTLTTSDKHQHEKAAWVDSIPALPGVAIRCSHAGVLVLHDIVKQKELCRLVMPENTAVSEPWQPQLCFPTGSKVMYIRGVRTCAVLEESNEMEAEEQTESIIVSLDLSTISELSPYFEKAPKKDEACSVMIHPMVTERVNALLEHRLRTHPGRNAKLQERWHRLRETFKAMQERRVNTESNGLEEIDEARSVLNSTPLSDSHWKEPN